MAKTENYIAIDVARLQEILEERYAISGYTDYRKRCEDRLLIDKRTLDKVIEEGVVKTRRTVRMLKRRFPDLFDK